MHLAATVLLILACALVVADAWSTRKALLNSRTEDNRLRLFLIRTLGLNGGTFGVSAVSCAALIAPYIFVAASPAMIVSYGMVVAAYTLIVKSNWEKSMSGYQGLHLR